MELKQLELFCLIMEHGSVSRAAEAAMLTQPTVSQHLKTLEEGFGLRLFDRMGRQMAPTKAGEILYSYAKRIVQLREEARQALDQFMGKVRGSLLIGGSTIPGDYILPGLIGSFNRSYPEVRVTLRIGDTQWVAERVLNNEVELGFVGAWLDLPSLIFQEFAKDVLVLVGPPDHPLAREKRIAPQQLAEIPLIARERGSGTRASLEEHLEAMGLRPEGLNVIAEMGSTEAVLRGVRAGVGFGVLSRRAVEDELRDGKVVEIEVLDTRWERTFYMIRHKLRSLSPLAGLFESYVLKVASTGGL